MAKKQQRNVTEIALGLHTLLFLQLQENTNCIQLLRQKSQVNKPLKVDEGIFKVGRASFSPDKPLKHNLKS